jgi:hypothetical protein
MCTMHSFKGLFPVVLALYSAQRTWYNSFWS